MTRNEIKLLALLGTTVTLATLAIIGQQEEIDDLKTQLSKNKRAMNSLKTACVKLITKADPEALRIIKNDLENDIMFEAIIHNF